MSRTAEWALDQGVEILKSMHVQATVVGVEILVVGVEILKSMHVHATVVVRLRISTPTTELVVER